MVEWPFLSMFKKILALTVLEKLILKLKICLLDHNTYYISAASKNVWKFYELEAKLVFVCVNSLECR